MLIGNRIREGRKNLNMNQEEFGVKIGVSKPSISNYELGHKNPCLETLIKIADLLNVSVDYLLGRDISVINEDTSENITLSSSDIQILNAIKSDNNLYVKVIDNPVRAKEILKRNIS